MTDPVKVHVDLGGRPTPAGVAFFVRRRRTLSTTFVYDAGYLALSAAYALDPALPLTAGSLHVDDLPGAFADASPDRWGRNLIAKRLRAENQGRIGPEVTDVDYLVGVSDATRQGALRFAVEDGGPFLATGTRVPPLLELPKLLRSSQRVARNEDDLSDLKELLNAGTGSLGGARPKASVKDDAGRLLIAKFSHPGDDWDVMAWEKTALDLAGEAGLPVPERRLVLVGNAKAVLLHRFDRTATGERIGYMSAMTLVSGKDADENDYLDVAETLPEHSARTNEDLAGLFRRAAVSVALHNTDDHLRNHGFLRAKGGWRLSPVFDVNPNPELSQGRQTSIAGAAFVPEEAAGLMILAEQCRLSRAEAAAILEEVLHAVRQWREVAQSNGVPRSDLTRFAEAFDHQEHILADLTASLGSQSP